MESRQIPPADRPVTGETDRALVRQLARQELDRVIRPGEIRQPGHLGAAREGFGVRSLLGSMWTADLSMQRRTSHLLRMQAKDSTVRLVQ